MDDVSSEREAGPRRAARRADGSQEGPVTEAEPAIRRRAQVRHPDENARAPGAPAHGGIPALRTPPRIGSRAVSGSAVRRGLPPAQRRPATAASGDSPVAPGDGADTGDAGPAELANGRSRSQPEPPPARGASSEVRDTFAAIMRRRASGRTSSTPTAGTGVNQDVTTSHAPDRAPRRALYRGTGTGAPPTTRVVSRPVRVTSRPVPVTTPPVRARTAALPLPDDELNMPRRGRSRHRSSRRRRQLPLWQEVPLLLLIAFVIAVLIRTFLLQAFFIPSGSMEHTLDVGDKVLVNKVVYDVRQPARGEVVVFRGTDRWAPEHKPPPTDLSGRIGRGLADLVGLSQPGEKDFIKRVIALPGDIVACCDAQGRVTVNGSPLDEPYVFENAPDDVPPSATECRSREFDPLTVPAGQVFVMGDHRLVSQDSRCQGPVPIENIVGRAFLVVWPASRWDILEVPETFATVPRSYADAASGGAPYRGDPGS